MRVLVVDDGEGLRKVLAALLISAGHETVASLADGNGSRRSWRVSGLISFSSTTSCRGETGWRILAHPCAIARSRCAVYDGLDRGTDRAQRAADAGAAGFIRKPFSQAQIIDELRDVAEARRLATRLPPLRSLLPTPAIPAIPAMHSLPMFPEAASSAQPPAGQSGA